MRWRRMNDEDGEAPNDNNEDSDNKDSDRNSENSDSER